MDVFARPFLVSSGRNDGIRTRDLLVPNQAHYQTVLRPDMLAPNRASDSINPRLEEFKQGHLVRFAHALQDAEFVQILQIRAIEFGAGEEVFFRKELLTVLSSFDNA